MKRLWVCFFIAILLFSSAYSNEGYGPIAGSMQKGSHVNKTPAILIFVSFSMPKQSLQSILRDAKKIHASVVIRGLVDNSFQKTYQAIGELVQASGGDGMELNPLWFKRFDIQSVPSVVIVPEGSSCFKQLEACDKNHNYDQMTGNITLFSALKMIRDKGSVTQYIAEEALNKLQDSSHV